MIIKQEGFLCYVISNSIPENIEVSLITERTRQKYHAMRTFPNLLVFLAIL